MVEREAVTDLGAFSSDGAVAAEWAMALADLQGAEVYWLSTVRPDGRPTCHSAVRRAALVSEGAELRSVAGTFESKYGRHLTAPRRHLVRSW